jgi:branched-chain amino acid transport system permease protein
MKAPLIDGVRPRALLLLGLMAVLLLAAPFLVSGYVLSVLIVALYFAYLGQAWNVMMGFAGQLSLGHSLYVGVAGYAAAALFVKFGIAPWLGIWPAMLVAMLFAAFIGFLAFRFGIAGVYFALLTIAFAEFTRVGFDHFSWVGASAGLFLPVSQRATNDVLALRGTPTMFYYVILALTAGAFVLCRVLLRSRIGYYWMAIREDQDAAQALGIDTFRCKMAAVLVSSAMTAVAGVFFAFYYNNLFPEQIFGITRSIEIILGPIIGGLGTLFGPILGAFVLQILAEALRESLALMGIEVPGLTQVFYGFCLLVVIIFAPHGIWPYLSRRLRL